MGRTGQFVIMILAGATLLQAQAPSNAPSQTTPDRTVPSQEEPSLTEGLITPETILPDGFTLRADEFPEIVQEKDGLRAQAVGNIKVRTDRGDTLRSSRATLEYTSSGGSKAQFFDQVELRSSNGIEIFADEATINETDKSILFTGRVATYQGTAVHRGDTVKYYYEDRKLSTTGLRTGFAPIFLEAGDFQVTERDKGNFYQGRNTGVTTHDAAEPNFFLRGEEVTILPGNVLKFKNVKLEAGGVPIFWLPRLTQKFDGEFNYRPVPGIRSNWGPYLLNRYTHDFGGPRDPETNTLLNPTYRAEWHADLYSRRGVGLGLDLDNYEYLDRPQLGTIGLYFIHDFEPTERRSAETRADFNTSERFIVQARQRTKANWLPGAKGYVDLNATYLSDRFFLEDFRSRDFIDNFQADNTVSLVQKWKESQLLTLWTRFRINEFYQSDQRLPEVALDQVRRPLFGSAILHESQNTIGLYREDLANTEERALRDELATPTTTVARRTTIEGLLGNTGFGRFHTYHELSAPLSWGGLQVVPRLGAGYTHYENIEGPLDTDARSLLHASVDASLKFTKRYPDWFSEKWGLNSALHVVQPYATATILASNDLDPSFRPIERLTASTRPRALQPGRFAAIDGFTDWQILRLGARNRILTQRNNSSHQWLSVDTYIDVFGNDPEFDRSVSNLFTDIHWSPLPWLDLNVETQVPLFSDSNFTEVSTGLQYMPNEDTEIGITHRFLRDHPILLDSNRLQLRAYHRFNEEWGIGSTHRWELADNTLEFQQYSLHRNLDSWAFTLGFFTRDNSEQTEFGGFFGFTLVDFPSISLPLNIDN